MRQGMRRRDQPFGIAEQLVSTEPQPVIVRRQGKGPAFGPALGGRLWGGGYFFMASSCAGAVSIMRNEFASLLRAKQYQAGKCFITSAWAVR